MSCSGPGGHKVAPRSVTIQADKYQWIRILDYYADGATLFAALDTKGQKNALPREFYLTTAGCSNNHQTKIMMLINAIYAFVRDIANNPTSVIGEKIANRPQPVSLDEMFKYTSIYRIDATYQGGEFGFLFTTACDSLNLTITKRVFPEAGILISKECVGIVQWAIYTDGDGGTYRQIHSAKSVDCGWVAAGTLKDKSCKGTDQWATYHDGEGGFYTELFKNKATECGYIPPLVRGSLKNKYCKGTDQWGTYNDGNYGTYDELFLPKAPDCGYVAPPPGGQLISKECVGFNQIGIYTDGNGGTRRETIMNNSPICGYVAPTQPPSTQPPYTQPSTSPGQPTTTPYPTTSGVQPTPPTMPPTTRPPVTLPPTTQPPPVISCSVSNQMVITNSETLADTFIAISGRFVSSGGGGVLTAVSCSRDEPYAGVKTAWCTGPGANVSQLQGLWGNTIYYPQTGGYGGTRNNNAEFARTLAQAVYVKYNPNNAGNYGVQVRTALVAPDGNFYVVVGPPSSYGGWDGSGFA